MIIILNKPFKALCQFTDATGRDTLKNYIHIKGLYPAGRLDYDSEGLVVLTDEGKLQAMISHPRYKLPKTYWVQVEGIPNEQTLAQLAQGVELKEGTTAPAQARLIDEPDIWPRHPPIRQRAHIPTSWLELTLREGKNRQVRRMTAAVGFPTLRLVRFAIGPWTIEGLQPGEFREVALASLLENPQIERQWRKISQSRAGHATRHKTTTRTRPQQKVSQRNKTRRIRRTTHI
jgi:23S rRNA pseudouridine2457 synthase